MCNRYAQYGSVAAMRAFMRTLEDGELVATSETDNLQPQQNIYPDQDAPIIRRRK
ncbi:MAG: SOS response-associated peptidase [Alphaproteobacteria bacterium]|nr:SOS response-associated peptidase [Alphaproteobacteria bacterium]